MGLDITAVRQLKRVECEDDSWGCGHFVLVPLSDDFPGRAGSIQEGHYETSEPRSTFGFRAGSYGGYNDWRSSLSVMVFGVPPQVVWQNPMGYAGRPFYELIDFSDCEGVIGPEVSAKLAKDFADWDEQAKRTLDDYDYEMYSNWHKAFKIASDGGAVIFH